MAQLELLRSFLSVYRTGSMTTGAGLLHLSQPAVSAHIRALERQMGRLLFERRARGVEPTQPAHDLAASAGPHLDALENLASLVRAGSDRIEGSLFLGGPAEFLTAVAIPLLAPLVDLGVRLQVRLGLPAELVAALASGELDLAVLTTRAKVRGVVHEPLYRERF